MTGKELKKLYFEKLRHKTWAQIDDLIIQLAEELDQRAFDSEVLERLVDVSTSLPRPEAEQNIFVG